MHAVREAPSQTQANFVSTASIKLYVKSDFWRTGREQRIVPHARQQRSS